MKKLTILLACLIMVLACKRDEIDFDLADDLRFTPEFEAPVVKATLSLEDLAAKDSNIRINSSNRISIRYLDDSIFTFDAIDFVNIPNQDPFEFPISPILSPLDLGMGFGTMGGVRLGQTIFEEGVIRYTIRTSTVFSDPLRVKVQIKNGSVLGAPMEKIVTVPVGVTEVNDSLNINNGEVDFSAGGVNFIGLRVEILNSATVTPQPGQLSLQVQFAKLKLLSAGGNFGQRKINIPQGKIDFDVAGYEQFTNGLILTDPRIKLIATSNIGVNFDVNVDFDGINNAGVLTSLNPPIQVVNGPQNPGGFNTDTLEFSKLNSQIVQFMAAVPTQIFYGGKAELNPQNANAQNFISQNSMVKFGVLIDLPLEFKADNFLLEEYLEDIDFFKENPDEIEAANLIFYTKNGFPFDANLSVSLIDTLNGDSIDGFVLDLLQAPPVDAEGRATQKASYKEIVELSQTTLDNLKKTDKLRLRVRLSTPDNGQKKVALYTDYELNVKIATQVQLNLKP